MPDPLSSTDGAGRLTLVRRGERVEATAKYQWWQELPEGETAEGLRSVGYEVVEFVGASALRAERERTRVLEEALRKLKDEAEPFHRLDLDLGDSHVRPDEWAEICEPLREALVNAGEALAAVAVEDGGEDRNELDSYVSTHQSDVRY